MAYEFRWKRIHIRIDSSWIYNLVLITYILSREIFPYYYKNISKLTYMWMGIVGSMGFSAIVLFHEISHILIGLVVGKPAKSVTLFLTGGVWEYKKSSIALSKEFAIALAGPLFNVVLFLIFNSILVAGEEALWPIEILALVEFFRTLNGIFIVSNLFPVLPFDTGRIVRALIWKVKNYEIATKSVSSAGTVLALLLILNGFIILFNGFIIGSICWVLTGLSLQKGAKLSKKEYIIKEILKGEKIKTIMSHSLVCVPQWISLEDFFENYLYRYHYKLFPVIGLNNEIVGCIYSENMKAISRDKLKFSCVKEYISSITGNSVKAQDDVLNLISIMNEKDRSRFIVHESKSVVGIVTHKDLLKYLAQKLI
jgi:Zn-dependent protease/predicted transcriptional regulator